MEVIKHDFLVGPDNLKRWNMIATIARRMGWFASETRVGCDHIEFITVPVNDIIIWNYLDNRGVFDL